MLEFKKQRTSIGVFFYSKEDYENFLATNMDISIYGKIEALPDNEADVTWMYCMFVLVNRKDLKNIKLRARKDGYRLRVLKELNVDNFYRFEQY